MNDCKILYIHIPTSVTSSSTDFCTNGLNLNEAVNTTIHHTQQLLPSSSTNGPILTNHKDQEHNCLSCFAPSQYPHQEHQSLYGTYIPTLGTPFESRYTFLQHGFVNILFYGRFCRIHNPFALCLIICMVIFGVTYFSNNAEKGASRYQVTVFVGNSPTQLVFVLDLLQAGSPTTANRASTSLKPYLPFKYIRRALQIIPPVEEGQNSQ